MSARWIEIVGTVDRGVLGRWIEECWASGLRSVGPVDCRSGGLRFVAAPVDTVTPRGPWVPRRRYLA